MASMNTRLNIENLDGNIVQKHEGSKQVRFKQLGRCIKTGVYAVHMIKCVWFEVELQGAQENHEAEEGAEGNAVERYRGDSNMAALGVVRVIEEYAHESLTFRNAFACKVISMWISVMKEDMDTRSSMYYMGFTCKSKAEIWVTKCLLVEAKEVILGLEIFRAQSEGDLSVNRDEEKKKSGFELRLVVGIATCALTKVVPSLRFQH
uniref:Zinc finger, CCHC-type n=1 Tax=Tanacetum cinerariifolium TaxID=118510 RepID=A0A6L2J3M2_TANCI|nr:zinc finger, CCHC-type [Tanacetum cinerariifolium]